MCNLPRRIHRLQRCGTGPQRAERDGRSLEGRPPRQYPGDTLVVQRRKRINPNRELTSRQPAAASGPQKWTNRNIQCANGVPLIRPSQRACRNAISAGMLPKCHKTSAALNYLVFRVSTSSGL